MFYPIHFTFFFYKILNYLFKSLSNNMLCLRYPQFLYLFIITNIYSVRNVSRSFSLYSSPIKSLHPKFSIIFNQTLRHPPFSSIKNIPPWIFPPFQFQYFSIPPLIFLFRKDHHRSKSPLLPFPHSFIELIKISYARKRRLHKHENWTRSEGESVAKKKKKKKEEEEAKVILNEARDVRSRHVAIVMKVTLEIGVDDQSGRRFQVEIESRWRTRIDRASKRKETKREERRGKRTREKRGCVCTTGEKVLGRVKRF